MRRAFSLIEILIVTAIVTTAFMSVLGLIRRAISLRTANRDSFLAAVIAQEGVELARYVRNDNWQKGYAFAQNLSQDGGVPADKLVAVSLLDKSVKDSRENIKNIKIGSQLKYGFAEASANQYAQDERSLVYRCSANNQIFYRQAAVNQTGGLTAPDNCEPTPFHRVVETVYQRNGTDEAVDDALQIRSIVYWRDHGNDKYFILDTLLTDYARKK